jgi:hypothetical protein
MFITISRACCTMLCTKWTVPTDVSHPLIPIDPSPSRTPELSRLRRLMEQTDEGPLGEDANSSNTPCSPWLVNYYSDAWGIC